MSSSIRWTKFIRHILSPWKLGIISYGKHIERGLTGAFVIVATVFMITCSFGLYYGINLGRYKHMLFYCALQVLRSSQIEGLWLPYVGQVCWHHFANSIFSLHVSVSLLGNSHNISNFFIIIILVLGICDQWSLVLLLLQKDYDSLEVQWWLAFSSRQVFFKVCMFFFKTCSCTLSRLQYSVSVTFRCTGKPEYSCASLYWDPLLRGLRSSSISEICQCRLMSVLIDQ